MFCTAYGCTACTLQSQQDVPEEGGAAAGGLAHMVSDYHLHQSMLPEDENLVGYK